MINKFTKAWKELNKDMFNDARIYAKNLAIKGATIKRIIQELKSLFGLSEEDARKIAIEAM